MTNYTKHATSCLTFKIKLLLANSWHIMTHHGWFQHSQTLVVWSGLGKDSNNSVQSLKVSDVNHHLQIFTFCTLTGHKPWFLEVKSNIWTHPNTHYSISLTRQLYLECWEWEQAMYPRVLAIVSLARSWILEITQIHLARLQLQVLFKCLTVRRLHQTLA